MYKSMWSRCYCHLYCTVKILRNSPQIGSQDFNLDPTTAQLLPLVHPRPVRSTLSGYSVLCAICFNSPSQSWLFLFFGFTPRSANLNLDIPLPVTWYLSQHLFSFPSAKAGLIQMCLLQIGILAWDFFLIDSCLPVVTQFLFLFFRPVQLILVYIHLFT